MEGFLEIWMERLRALDMENIRDNATKDEVAIKRGNWITYIPKVMEKSSKKVVRSTQRGGSWKKMNLDVRMKGPRSIVTRCENRTSCVNPLPTYSEEMN